MSDDFRRPEEEYGQRPEITPEQAAAARQASVAVLMAGIALVSTLAVPVLMPFMFAPVAIVVALLSRGRERALHGRGAVAVGLASLTLAINAVILAMSMFVMWKVLTDPVFYQQADQIMQQYYGMSLESLLQPYYSLMGGAG